MQVLFPPLSTPPFFLFQLVQWIVLFNFVLNSNLVAYNSLAWFTLVPLRFPCSSCLPWMISCLCWGLLCGYSRQLLTEKHLGVQSDLNSWAGDGVPWEQTAAFLWEEWEQVGAKRATCHQIPCKFPPFLSRGCQSDWIPQGDFFHCEQLS